MIIWLLIGVLALIFFLGGARWLAETDPKAVKRMLALAAAILLAGVAIALIFTGRFMLAVPLALGGYTAYRRYKQARSWWDIASSWGKDGGKAAGESSIETPYLSMSLDHASAGLDGLVRTGRFKGKRLSAMPQSDLLSLLDDLYDEDGEGARLLEAFLDRRHESWRDGRDQKSPPATAGPMTVKEASQILGVKDNAPPEEIRAAHHKLMLKLHPDQGGSTYLAAKINEAKDVLLTNTKK